MAAGSVGGDPFWAEAAALTSPRLAVFYRCPRFRGTVNPQPR
jgi:hypothetical protein